MEQKARRRHVPAFGEWNYYSSSSSPEEPHSGAAAGDAWWYAAAAEPEARSDAWFRYSPPPRRPAAAKKARRPGGAAAAAAGEQKQCHDGGGSGSALPSTEAARARASGYHAGAARAPAKGGRRVVAPVDADLYRVPPAPADDASFTRRPRRKRAARSLWMGCLGGFNCVA